MDKFWKSLQLSSGSLALGAVSQFHDDGAAFQVDLGQSAEMASVTVTETVKPTDCRAGGNSATMGTPESPGVAIWNETGDGATVLQGTGRDKGNPDPRDAAKKVVRGRSFSQSERY